VAKKKKKRDDNAAYQKQRVSAALTSREKSLAGRDIAPLPPVKDQARKDACGKSLELFCRTYFPDTYYLPWSPDHLKAIQRIETAVWQGGLFAYALPRGSGKTSLAEEAVEWATLYGYRQFPLVIGSDESSALEILDSIKSHLENSDRLLEDFPEVCYPIRKLEGIAHRANGQLFNGKRTHIHWSAAEIVLPMIPGSKASGAVVAVTGITGRIRGMKYTRADGKSVRPDLVVPDDPQTDESAKSPSQCDERIRILSGAVLGLAGPGQRISVIMPCTVIRPGDVADRLLDRKKNPDWQGERAKFFRSFPRNAELWEEYRRIRSDGMQSGDDGKAGTAFYKANRAAMDEGADVSWPQRHHPTELSAVQHGMNLRFKLGEHAFFAEYQNDPLPDVTPDPEQLTAEQIAGKVNGRGRGEVPNDVEHVVAFIDVQKPLLPWVVCGFAGDFTGVVLDYGTWPDQNRSYFQRRDAKVTIQHLAARDLNMADSGLEAQIRWALDNLAGALLSRSWHRDDGAAMKIERCLVDANWGESTDVVYQFVRESPHAAVLLPSHGKYVGASSLPFAEYRRKRGDRIGANWRMPNVQGRRVVRYALFDSNFWKSFAHARLAVPIGGAGSLSLFGRDAERHKLFAEHLTAEDAIKTEGRGRTVMEWKIKATRPDNDWFDCIAGCCVAASIQGVSLADSFGPRRAATAAPIKLSEVAKQRKHHQARR
jgi:hypothetical protein